MADKYDVLKDSPQAKGVEDEMRRRAGAKPNAKTFKEAREGAFSELMGAESQAPAPADPKPSPAPSKTPRPKAPEPAFTPGANDEELTQLQRVYNENPGFTYEQAREALSRRKKKSAKETYDSIE